MAQMGLDALRNNLTNPQRIFMWEFEIPAPKGVGDGDIWILRAQSIEEPERTFEPIDINFKGTGGMRVPGRERYTHEMRVTVLEGEDALTYQAIQSWMALIRDNVSGISLPDNSLKADAMLTLLNTQGGIARVMKLVGLYPQTKGALALVYDNSDKASYEVTFAFDRWESVSA